MALVLTTYIWATIKGIQTMKQAEGCKPTMLGYDYLHSKFMYVLKTIYTFISIVALVSLML